MQAIKEKLSDMNAMRKAKAEAREEEKAEKELAKARVEVAHEVRMAREAEAAMDLHVQKAAEKVAEQERKHPAPMSAGAFGEEIHAQDSHGHNADPGYSAHLVSASGPHTASIDSTASVAGTDYAGRPPTNINFL